MWTLISKLCCLMLLAVLCFVFAFYYLLNVRCTHQILVFRMLCKHGSILWVCFRPYNSDSGSAVCPSDPAVSGGHCCISLMLYQCWMCHYRLLCLWIERSGAFTKEWLWFQNEREPGVTAASFWNIWSWESGWIHPLLSLYDSVTCMFVTQRQKSIPLFKHELHHHHILSDWLCTLTCGILPFISINHWIKFIFLG